MPSTRRLRTASLGLLIAGALAASFALTGCGSIGISQRVWEHRVEAVDGVIDASWSYRNGWPETGSSYRGDIVVSPELTEGQAAEIAEVSCSSGTRLDHISVSTSADYAAPQKVSAPNVGNACFDADSLVQLARASAAMLAVDPAFVGEIDLFGYDWEDRYGIRVSATEESMLLDALRELHARIDDRPLSFEGATGESGRSLTAFGEPVYAELDPGDRIEAELRVMRSALQLDRRAIRLDGSGVIVELASTDELRSPAVEELRAEAEAEGVQLEVILPRQGDSAEEEAALIAQLEQVTGGASLTVPAGGSSYEIDVYANAWEGLEEAIGIVAAAPQQGLRFRLHGPEPDTFWVLMGAGRVSVDEAIEFYGIARRLANEIDGVWRTVLSLQGNGEHTLGILLADSAIAEQGKQARRQLEPLVQNGVFKTVSLYSPQQEPSWQFLEKNPRS